MSIGLPFFNLIIFFKIFNYENKSKLYHVSNTFHSKKTYLYFLIHFFLFIFINLSITPFCDSTKGSTFFFKF